MGATTLPAATAVAVPALVPASFAAAALLVRAGCAWFGWRAARRHGIAAPTVAGATVLTVTAWTAVDAARRALPDPPDGDAVVLTGAVVSVTSGGTLDAESARTVAALLIGAALLVPTCARLGRDVDPAP